MLHLKVLFTNKFSIGFSIAFSLWLVLLFIIHKNKSMIFCTKSRLFHTNPDLGIMSRSNKYFQVTLNILAK